MLQRDVESDPWSRALDSRSAAAASDMRDAMETAERELVELRAMVTRKGYTFSSKLYDILAFLELLNLLKLFYFRSCNNRICCRPITRRLGE